MCHDVRLSAIEERLGRLEGKGSSDLADASVVVVESEDAGVASRVGPVATFVPDAADGVGQCLEYAGQRCAQIAARETARDRSGAGPHWVKDEEPLPPASSSARGRECLGHARVDCQAWKDREPSDDRWTEWLDAQLVPEKLDKEYTARLRAKVAKKTREPASSIDVQCTQQFCRFGKVKGYADAGGDDPGFAALANFMDDARQVFGGGPYMYVVRRGYSIGGQRTAVRNQWGKP